MTLSSSKTFPALVTGGVLVLTSAGLLAFADDKAQTQEGPQASSNASAGASNWFTEENTSAPVDIQSQGPEPSSTSLNPSAAGTAAPNETSTPSVEPSAEESAISTHSVEPMPPVSSEHSSQGASAESTQALDEDLMTTPMEDAYPVEERAHEESVEPCITDHRIHIIAEGQTLSSISAQYGVSVDAIALTNRIQDLNMIYAGSALVIPTN